MSIPYSVGGYAKVQAPTYKRFTDGSGTVHGRFMEQFTDGSGTVHERFMEASYCLFDNPES